MFFLGKVKKKISAHIGLILILFNLFFKFNIKRLTLDVTILLSLVFYPFLHLMRIHKEHYPLTDQWSVKPKLSWQQKTASRSGRGWGTSTWWLCSFFAVGWIDLRLGTFQKIHPFRRKLRRNCRQCQQKRCTKRIQ